MDTTEIVKGYFRAHASGDRAELRRWMTDDYTFKGPMMEASSADELLEKMAAFGCGGITNEIHEVVVDGDRAAVRFTCTFSEPAPLSLEMSEWLTVRGGKVASSRLYFDASKMPSMT